MKKEKQVKSYQRRTKSGKMITVKAHTAKYDSSEKDKKSSKKKGSGKEFEKLSKSADEDPLQKVGDKWVATDPDTGEVIEFNEDPRHAKPAKTKSNRKKWLRQRPKEECSKSKDPYRDVTLKGR